MSKDLTKNNCRTAASKKGRSYACPACRQGLAVYHDEITTMTTHFRDYCPERSNWIKHIVPRIPIYVWTVLGLWNHEALNFTEWGYFLLLTPMIKENRICLPNKIVIWIQHTWKKLIHWDSNHHGGMKWLSSGSAKSHAGALSVLFPNLYSDLCLVKLPKKKDRATVNTLHTKCDLWTRKDRKYNRYLQDKYNAWLTDQTNQVRIWSSGSDAIGKWTAKRYSNRLDISKTTPEDEQDLDMRDYYYFLPGTDLGLAIYDACAVEFLFLHPVSMVTLQSIVVSFRMAWNSYMRLYGFPHESPTQHQILFSDCRRYLLIKGRNSAPWSIAMQYDFIAWWMTVDHCISEFFTKYRRDTRLSVPYMIPVVNGHCPFCYRFDSCSRLCHVRTPLSIECFLNDSICFPRLDWGPKTVQLLGHQQVEQYLRVWLQELYKTNTSLVGLTHIKSSTIDPKMEQLFQTLQLYPQLCHQHSRSDIACPESTVPSVDPQHPILYTHSWKLITQHEYHASCDYPHGRSKRHVKSWSFFNICCSEHRSNFIVAVNHLYGYMDLYNLLDLDTPHFAPVNSNDSNSVSDPVSKPISTHSFWTPCIRLLYSIHQLL